MKREIYEPLKSMTFAKKQEWIAQQIKEGWVYKPIFMDGFQYLVLELGDVMVRIVENDENLIDAIILNQIKNSKG